MSKPVFLEYDPEAEKAELIKLFEDETQKKLYPAQLENILINLFQYKATQLVAKFNDAALLNLPQYSRGEILDLIGEMFETQRLSGSEAQTTFKIELYEPFTSDLTIPKGLEVLTKDEKYTFYTVSDLTIPAGETIGTVTAKSEEKAEELNNYGIGDINILLKPLSYIKTAVNITAAEGGTGEEEDAAYAERILLAPESFTCAGSRQSYIYHTLSAHPAIIDATADSPQIPAAIAVGGTTYTETGGTITGSGFSASVDYKTGTCALTAGETLYTITIPPQTTVNIYPLTKEETTSNAVLSAVTDKFDGEEITPMTDVVRAIAPTAKVKAATINVILEEDCDAETAKTEVNAAIEDYKATLRKKLNAEIIPSHIIAKIGNISGVYSVETPKLEKCSAAISEYFVFNPTVNITQRGA